MTYLQQLDTNAYALQRWSLQMHAPLLLCKTSRQQGLCKHTCQGVLFMVCSDAPPMYCNTGFGQMHPPIFNAAIIVCRTSTVDNTAQCVAHVIALAVYVYMRATDSSSTVSGTA